MIRRGKIVSVSPSGTTILIPFDPDVVLKECEEAILYVPDGRTISPEQRRKAWALIGEIAAWGGYIRTQERTEVNAAMKRMFLLKHVDDLTAEAIRFFSLSNVDMTTASMYISFLVDYILENGIETHVPLLELCDDVEKAVYSALIHKRCIVCGRPATIHHVDHVGMGHNRNEICHIGMKALPLCWNDCAEGHHQEVHRIGDKALIDKYHLIPVEIDERIAKAYRLKGGKHEQDHPYRQPDPRP